MVVKASEMSLHERAWYLRSRARDYADAIREEVGERLLQSTMSTMDVRAEVEKAQSSDYNREEVVREQEAKGAYFEKYHGRPILISRTRRYGKECWLWIDTLDDGFWEIYEALSCNFAEAVCYLGHCLGECSCCSEPVLRRTYSMTPYRS